MAKLHYGISPTSVILRLKLLNSSVTTGAGFTGLTYASAGLVIGTIQIGEAAPTAYTATGATIEDIVTLGTYAAPTATKCRFKEVSVANHPGLYEIQLADARFANTGSLIVSISGATNLAQCDVEVQCSNLGSNMIQILGTAVSTPATAGILDTNVKNIANAVVNTASAQVGANVVSQANIDFGALQKTSLNAATPASVTGAVGSVTGNVGGNVTGSVGSVVSFGTLVTDIWHQLLTAITTAGSVGKLIKDYLDAAISSRSTYAGGAVASVTGAVGSVTGAVGSVTGNVGGNVVGSAASITGAVGSVTAGVTVTTNNDKTGYGLSAVAIQAIWDALTSALITAGSIGKKLADWIVGTIDTYTGNTKQTGDSFARLGAPVGASISADIATVDTVVDAVKVVTDKVNTALELDGAVYRYTINALELAPSGGATAGQIADAVWDEAAAEHVAAGSMGKKLNDVVGGSAVNINHDSTTIVRE